MQSPFIAETSQAIAVAQSAVALTFAALLVRSRFRSGLATLLFVAGVFLSALVPVFPAMLAGCGFRVENASVLMLSVCALGAVLSAIATCMNRFVWDGIVSLTMLPPLAALGGFLPASEAEIAALSLVAQGIWLGLHMRRVDRGGSFDTLPGRQGFADSSTKFSYLREDLCIFFGALTIAVLASTFVLLRQCATADEWANTFQADLFAQFKAFGQVPDCAEAFRSFWIFFWQGRSFSQYTPGWPFLMTPFQAVGASWFAGPFFFAITAIGIARLARRMARESSLNQAEVRAAGLMAAFCAVLGWNMVLHGASRFSQIAVCAEFAWMLEAALAMTSFREPVSGLVRMCWGLVFGSVVALAIATRPVDGVFLSWPVILFVAYQAIREPLTRRAASFAAIAFASFGILTLIVLRLQLGVWFKTGYSIASLFWPGLAFRMSMPQPHQWKDAVPLAIGAFAWLPAAPALALAGLSRTRGRGQASMVMLCVGTCSLWAFYAWVEFGGTGRQGDVYGPRYQLPALVMMSVGTGLALAPLYRSVIVASLDGWRRCAPFAIVAVAMLAAVARFGFAVYPKVRTELAGISAPVRAVADSDLHNAIVFIRHGDVITKPLDLTQNLPRNPPPDVLILRDIDVKCVREKYPNRSYYRAVGGQQVTLLPYR